MRNRWSQGLGYLRFRAQQGTYRKLIFKILYKIVRDPMNHRIKSCQNTVIIEMGNLWYLDWKKTKKIKALTKISLI